MLSKIPPTTATNFSIELARKIVRADPAEIIGRTGADILKKAAILGSSQKACVVIVDHEKFNTSSYGYEGRVILVNTGKISVPKHVIMVGTELGRISTSYVPIKPGYVKKFLGARA